jgi:hypothetical protein
MNAQLASPKTPNYIPSYSVREKLTLKTTKSGRKVLPPLAYWRNQVAHRDFYGNTYKIDPGSTELTAASPHTFGKKMNDMLVGNECIV